MCLVGGLVGKRREIVIMAEGIDQRVLCVCEWDVGVFQ